MQVSSGTNFTIFPQEQSGIKQFGDEKVVGLELPFS